MASNPPAVGAKQTPWHWQARSSRAVIHGCCAGDPSPPPSSAALVNKSV